MGLEDNVIELARQVGELVGQVKSQNDALATKADVQEIKTKLDDHLSAHTAESVYIKRLKIIAISAALTALTALIPALLAVFL